jgi:hypothetical protein
MNLCSYSSTAVSIGVFQRYSTMNTIIYTQYFGNGAIGSYFENITILSK